jgi:hypothetical protein
MFLSICCERFSGGQQKHNSTPQTQLGSIRQQIWGIVSAIHGATIPMLLQIEDSREEARGKFQIRTTRIL